MCESFYRLNSPFCNTTGKSWLFMPARKPLTLTVWARVDSHSGSQWIWHYCDVDFSIINVTFILVLSACGCSLPDKLSREGGDTPLGCSTAILSSIQYFIQLSKHSAPEQLNYSTVSYVRMTGSQTNEWPTARKPSLEILDNNQLLFQFPSCHCLYPFVYGLNVIGWLPV